LSFPAGLSYKAVFLGQDAVLPVQNAFFGIPGKITKNNAIRVT